MSGLAAIQKMKNGKTDFDPPFLVKSYIEKLYRDFLELGGVFSVFPFQLANLTHFEA